MCITPSECLVRLGDFGQYCPVSLADRGELVDCSVNSSLEFAAEFRGRYYKMASRVELELFLADPARYVPPQALRKLPAPDLLPKRRTEAEVKAMFPKQIELKGYCPVTYLDGKLRLVSFSMCGFCPTKNLHSCYDLHYMVYLSAIFKRNDLLKEIFKKRVSEILKGEE